MQHRILASEIMTRDVVSIDAKMEVAAAAELLCERQVSNAAVVEKDFTREILVGFVSEKDLIQCYASGRMHAEPHLRVADVMRPHPVSVRPETDLYTLAAIFMQHGYRHVPVVVGQVLQGMVSRRDVLKALLADYREWQRQDPATRRAPDLAAIFTTRFLLG